MLWGYSWKASQGEVALPGVLKNKVELFLQIKQWVGVGKHTSSRALLASKFVGIKLLPPTCLSGKFSPSLLGVGKMALHPFPKNFRLYAPRGQNCAPFGFLAASGSAEPIPVGPLGEPQSGTGALSRPFLGLSSARADICPYSKPQLLYLHLEV